MISRKITKYFLLAIALFMVVIPLASCSSPGQSSDTTATIDETALPENEVLIRDDAFMPDDLTIKVGVTITWINKDSYNHTVTENNGMFDSGNIANGEKFSFTFNNEGTFDYNCSIHTFMNGKITVTK